MGCRDAAPRGGGPGGIAALLRQDASRSLRTCMRCARGVRHHARSVGARRSHRRAPRACGVRRARGVRHARRGGFRRALPQRPLHITALSAVGPCRAERRGAVVRRAGGRVVRRGRNHGARSVRLQTPGRPGSNQHGRRACLLCSKAYRCPRCTTRKGSLRTGVR